MNIIIYLDIMIPRQPQQPPPALDVESQSSALTPVDAPSQENGRPCHYAMVSIFSKRESTSRMPTNQSILRKFDGLTSYPLTHLPTYFG